eukprot:GHVP01014764.1.p1 GENE.GHVP01014764.1~~GHVP01014764.1.p1  ORF type:complete len:329 (+),score=48.00 GHVP01014764.1:552-1538(+)
MDVLSIAPMMEYSHKYSRAFQRILSKNLTLYTEMVTSNEVLYFTEEKLKNKLGEIDDRTVVQIASNKPDEVSKAIGLIKEKYGALNFNLNIGCPSKNAQKGGFGAILMKNTELLYDMVQNILKDHSDILLSIKCRIGVDECEGDYFTEFIDRISKAGIKRFIIHARKAVLSFRATIDNCKIPPLDHEFVIKFADTRRDLEIVLNGGILSMEAVQDLLKSNIHGVMIGRQSFVTPLMFHDIDNTVFCSNSPYISIKDAITKYLEYLEGSNINKHMYLYAIDPICRLSKGFKFGKKFRNILSEGKKEPEKTRETIERGIEFLMGKDVYLW